MKLKAILIAACFAPWVQGAEAPSLAPPIYLPPGVTKVGCITNRMLSEDSGVIASRTYTNLFWTHTDGGKKPILHAINREGISLAEFPVAASVHDWEDIAIDDKHRLYLGDIGNNDALRKEIRVYRIAEPDPRKNGKRLKVGRTWRLRFPDKPFDCESLFVFDHSGYVVSKVFDNAQATLYRFSLDAQTEPAVLEKVCKLAVTAPITGADISPDGRKLALVSHGAAYLFQIDGRIERAGSVRPFHVKVGNQRMEGCTFVPEGLLATSESRDIFLFSSRIFRSGGPLD